MGAISQSGFLQALGWALLNSFWQMAFLWILLQGILLFLKIKRPAHKTKLAELMLFSGFAWFLFTFLSLLNTSNEGISATPVIASIPVNDKFINLLQQVIPIASVLYLALLIIPVIRFIRNYQFVKFISTYGLSKIEVGWRLFVKKVAAQMGIRKPVHIWLSDKISSPVTIGFFKPIILVPLAAINQLTPQQVEAVLLHELSHIRRYDYLINLVINFIQTILYFNPFVKSFVRIIELGREKSCDERVVQFQYDPHSYASALLILEKSNRFSRPLAIAVSGKKNDLIQRIELLLGIQKNVAFSFNRIAGFALSLFCIVALNALLIFSKPSTNRQLENALVFNAFPSPLLFHSGNSIDPNLVPAEKIIYGSSVSVKNNKITKASTQQPSKENKKSIASAVPTGLESPDPSFVHVNYLPTIKTPELTTKQLTTIEDALSKSKELLQEEYWKEIEKNIADVMTSEEKDQLKKEFIRQFSHLDLTKWKEKLSLGYNQVDWDLINERLGNAVYQLKLDSLQRVNSDLALTLTTMEMKLTAENQKGIADSDITLNLIRKQQAEVQKLLNTIRAIRNKKIIHL